MMERFTDRQYNLGDERRYQLTRQDGTTEIVELEKQGIAEPGSRINAAALNQIVDHVNDSSIHIPYSEFAALKTRVQTLEDAILNDFNHNIFKVSFSNPVGVKISRGWFDPGNARLVIK